MIEVVSSMGGDLTVVNSARVSFSKHVTSFDDVGDYKLIKYLLKHKHFTPFTHPQLTLRIKMPIFIARQWFKHMIGFSRNEVSRRYVSSKPEFYMPTVLREAAANKKQGSGDRPVAQNNQLLPAMESFYEAAEKMYSGLITSSVCPEQARMVLPQAMMTEFYETGSLSAYLRLVSLRTEATAQKEIRDYAKDISLILQAIFPQTMRAIKELEDE